MSRGYPPPPGPNASANLFTPNVQDMVGNNRGGPDYYRLAYFPTAPIYPIGTRYGLMIRDYTVVLNPTDQDYAVGTETSRAIQFSEPVTVVAMNGAAFPNGAGNAFPVGVGPRDCWFFRAEYTTGEKWQTNSSGPSSVLASCVLGSGGLPGETGGVGQRISAGASVQVFLTPLLPDLIITVSFRCQEYRGLRNFSREVEV